MGHCGLALSCALGSSDLNRGLLDGRVNIQGVQLQGLTFSSPERHWRMFRHAEFDIAEVSFGAYLSLQDRRPGEFVAIPAFPHRRFRHSYIFTAQDGSIKDPSELSGGRIGIRTWTNTAGVWTRGILQDHYGVDLKGVEWVTQDVDTAGTENLPPDYRISGVETDDSVLDMVRQGRLDALIYPEIPDILDAPSGVRRIFADATTEEQKYFASTGLFPIMHTVVLHGELVAEHPWLPYEVLKGFRASKDLAMAEAENPRSIALAWARDTYERQRSLMGDDPWAYDAHTSAPAIETLIRYAAEQQIVSSAPSIESLFHASCLSDPPSYVRR